MDGQTENEDLIYLECDDTDFDPYIKMGRDNIYYVKRPIINHLVENTRYSEEEIRNLSTMYTAYAKEKTGLTMSRFNDFWAQITNIEHHPFLIDIFIFFDQKTQDQTVDFLELVKGMDIVERGTLEEKCGYCFFLYDVME